LTKLRQEFSLVNPRQYIVQMIQIW